MSALGFLASIAFTACASTAVVSPSRVSPAAPAHARPPAADADGDGIADRDDRCPDAPETRNGYQDDDGCPDLAPPPAASPNDVGRIVERIGFPHDSAELKPALYPMLDAIAVVLKMQPQQFPLIALEGHAADNEHAPMRLSLARASAVRVALQARGVDASRLLARASGSMAPALRAAERDLPGERTRRRIHHAARREAARPHRRRRRTPRPARRTPDDKPPAPSAPLPRCRSNAIEFSRGSAVLAPSALANLDLLAGFMKANAGVAGDRRVRGRARAWRRDAGAGARRRRAGLHDGVRRLGRAPRHARRAHGTGCVPIAQRQVPRAGQPGRAAVRRAARRAGGARG